MEVANIFESNLPQNGERATESAHRKIELQTPQDLTYLIANVTRTAREKIDRHLPPDAASEGEDAMRKRVEVLVDDVCPDCLGCGEIWLWVDVGCSIFAIHSALRRIACRLTVWTRRSWKPSWRRRRREKVGSDATEDQRDSH